MTDQTESEYAPWDSAEFLTDPEAVRAYVEEMQAVIRALEASRDLITHERNDLLLRLDADGIRDMEAELACIRADRDRLAEGVNDLLDRIHLMAQRYGSAVAEHERLTDELAAARGALQWIADNSGRDTWLSQFERRFNHGDVDDLMAAIDAARRAGGDEA